MKDVAISVVLPVHNERDVLPALHERLVEVLAKLGEPYEILFVDDGSTDGSDDLLDLLHEANPSTKVAHLSRNFGQESAVAAGMSLARGQAVVLMDADLQDPPEVIPDLIARWREGAQVVYAERSSRSERFVKRWAIKTFHHIFGRVADVAPPGDVGLFSLLDRRVVDQINAMPEGNRYLTGLRAYAGYRQSAVAYDRPDRAAGKPSQSWRRLVRLGLNAIFGFSYVPLRLVTFTGLVISTVAIVFAVVVTILSLADSSQVGEWSWVLVVLCFLGGVQLLSLGIIGEYLARIYDEAKRRPNFIVARTVGLDEPSSRSTPNSECA
jgi:polyisoprenyl-phosphate glycosyltransferase